MPNFFSAFTTEVFKPIVTLLIPGAIGISTWLIALLWKFEDLQKIVISNHTEATLVILLGMIFAGLVFEDAGSHWEAMLDERADNRSQKLHSQIWYDYLRTAFRADPVGRRYLRTLVMRLKFELGVAFAMLSASLGLIWLFVLGLNTKTFLVAEAICTGFIAWGLIEASSTHDALAKNRKALHSGIQVVG